MNVCYTSIHSQCLQARHTKKLQLKKRKSGGIRKSIYVTYTENLSVAKKQISDMAFLTHLTHAQSSCYAVNEKKKHSLYSWYKWLLFLFLFDVYIKCWCLSAWVCVSEFSVVFVWVWLRTCVRSFSLWRELWFWAVYTNFVVFFIIIINNKIVFFFCKYGSVLHSCQVVQNWYFKWVFVHVTNMRPVL